MLGGLIVTPLRLVRARMKAYFISLAVGVLVGVIYALLQVRPPAPPVIALVGLLGILFGEQIPPWIKQTWAQQSTQRSPMRGEVKSRVFPEPTQSAPNPSKQLRPP